MSVQIDDIKPLGQIQLTLLRNVYETAFCNKCGKCFIINPEDNTKINICEKCALPKLIEENINETNGKSR